MNNTIARLLRLPFAALMALLSPLTRIANKIFGKLIDKLLQRLESVNKAGYFDDYFKDHENPLLRGDLHAASLNMYPKSRFPTFYKRIAGDLRKSIVVDGRIRGSGYLPAYTLPQAYISDRLVNDSKQAAMKAGLLTLIVSFIFISAAAGIYVFENVLSAALPSYGLPAGTDDWGMFPIAVGLQKVMMYSGALLTLATKLVASLSVAVALVIVPAAFVAAILAILAFWGSWRNMIFKAMDDHAEPLRRETKESIVRWKHRFEQRELEEQAYLAQLNEVERVGEKEEDLVTIGEATGHFNFRGLLTGPRQNQKMRLAISDLFQNTIVLGGTGSGKTRTIILPVITQLISQQDKQDISLYVTDSKGVLWKDVAEIAENLGKKVQVIGVGEHEMGVDLLDGISPSFASDLIKSVMRQLGGANADDFWPNMATTLTRHVFTVLRAWERTEGGIEYAESSSERPYSLVSAYRLALDAKNVDGWMKQIEADILNCIETDYSAISDFAKSDLYSSLSYLRNTWPTMASDTRSGIEGNVTNALGGFEADVRLREKFASGEKADITIDECWGKKITCVNLPDSELGNAGKIINVFLKTLLFNKAKLRQAVDPNIAQKQQLAFIGDEYQSIITADVSGISDATFPNISRSTGLFYIVASQGIVGLEQAIGQYAAANFMNNMRNKIFLQIEESATMNFAKMLAGKTMRFQSFSGDHHESFESMRRESGFDPLLRGAAVLERNVIDRAGLMTGLVNSFGKFELSEVRKMFVFQSSTRMFGLPKQNDDYRSESNRVEDKNSDYMKSGNEMTDVLTDGDLVGMGRMNAYCFIWRSGHSRQDIVRLTDISKFV